MQRPQVCKIALSGHAVVVIAAVLLCSSSSSATNRADIVTFGVAGSVETAPGAINSQGLIAGSYATKDNVLHGFIRTTDGAITTFDGPRATYTFVNGLNHKGVSVGSFGRSMGMRQHCFIRNPNGRFEKFDIPKAKVCRAVSISDDFIAGAYGDGATTGHGFLRVRGAVTSFDVLGSEETFPAQVNDVGVVTGEYLDQQSDAHGFVRAADGTITTFDVEGSTQTVPRGINAGGTIVGYYSTPDTKNHGFLRDQNGNITTFDYGANSTEPSAINRQNTVVGLCGCTKTIGFIRSHNGAKLRRIKADGFPAYPSAINDYGVIVGTFYSSPRRSTYGFVRFPN